jgi:hypothetical protein
MVETKEEVVNAETFFSDVKSHTDGDFQKSAALWMGQGPIQPFPVIITETGDDAIADFKVNVDLPGISHYVHAGRKFDQLESYWNGDNDEEFYAKLQAQVPRDPKDVASTYEWMLKSDVVDNAKAKIATHKKAFKSNDKRVAFVRFHKA